MKREEMLTLLKKLPYVLIWPDKSWTDVLGTEREIWVNSQGYGYIMCDEPTQFWEGNGVGLKNWRTIQEKIKSNSLTFEDIENSPIAEMLDAIGYVDFEDREQLCTNLTGLAETDYPVNYFYALVSSDGVEYFDSKNALNKAREKDWADELWEDMSDDLLSEWIERLSIEDDPALDSWLSLLKK